MERIRVLHVGLDTHLGGIETYLLKISSNIDRSRFQFDFLAYDNVKPCFYEELTSLGCCFSFVSSRRKNWVRNKSDLKNLFSQEHFDIVHCHLNSLTYITPALEGLKSGSKVIIHSRNGGQSSGSSSRILGLINRYRMPWDKVTRAAVSDLAGKWMFGDKPFIVLNNGLDTARYCFSEEKRLAARRSLGLGEDVEIILNVGALRAQKNHSFMLDVFDSYHQKHRNSVLVLVGEGELESEIRNRVSALGLDGAVVFAGKRDDIPAVLSASDKFLFPSLYEGFPNALIEAETSGLACVASDTITQQACLKNCHMISLDAPISEWVTALEKPSPLVREECPNMVEDAGFGIKQEICRLENLYESLIVRK